MSDLSPAHPLTSLLHRHRSREAGFGEAVGRTLAAIQPGPTAPEDARALLSALEGGKLTALRAGGRSCRELAAEALLGLGYPWALHIHPADLASYRRFHRNRRWSQRAFLGLAFALGAGGGAWLSLFLGR